MKWTHQAEEAISKVPFFVRKKVRKKVEEEAARGHSEEVRMEHVLACQKRFLNNMEEEVRGYQVEACFGSGGCPNRALISNELVQRLEALLHGRDLRAFLKERVKGPLKMHHEFRISLSDCPNACSRPQIVDIGLIGACSPQITGEVCTQCGSCTEVCKEGAMALRESPSPPSIDMQRCVSCGQCIGVCPSGTLQPSKRGFRILVGGKLGRHPQLGKELPGIHSIEDTLHIVDRCINHYLKHNLSGERFGSILNRTGIDEL